MYMDVLQKCVESGKIASKIIIEKAKLSRNTFLNSKSRNSLWGQLCQPKRTFPGGAKFYAFLEPFPGKNQFV